MLVLMAVKPVDFGAPDMGALILFIAAVAGVFLFLVFMRGLGRVKERNIEMESAWQSFRKIAQVRGLNTEQIRALAAVVRAVKLKRPAQIIGSISVFDRSVDRAQAKGALTETQQILLETVRRKLVTTAFVRDEREERRQYMRAECSLPVSLVPISRTDLELELRSTEGEDEEMIKQKLAEMARELEPVNGQIITISAGGLAVKLGEELDGEEGDYVTLAGEEGTLPVDINGFIGEIRSIQRLEDGAALVLHLGFLSYPLELRRQIIRLVYETLEANQKKKAQAASRKGPGGPQVRGENPADTTEQKAQPGEVSSP